jgi:hypothetical protein
LSLSATRNDSSFVWSPRAVAWSPRTLPLESLRAKVCGKCVKFSPQQRPILSSKASSGGRVGVFDDPETAGQRLPCVPRAFVAKPSGRSPGRRRLRPGHTSAFVGAVEAWLVGLRLASPVRIYRRSRKTKSFPQADGIAIDASVKRVPKPSSDGCAATFPLGALGGKGIHSATDVCRRESSHRSINGAPLSPRAPRGRGWPRSGRVRGRGRRPEL